MLNPRKNVYFLTKTPFPFRVSLVLPPIDPRRHGDPRRRHHCGSGVRRPRLRLPRHAWLEPRPVHRGNNLLPSPSLSFSHRCGLFFFTSDLTA